MSDILCIYYSRTGSTRDAMTEIAQALGAELVELKDGVNRSGFGGWLQNGPLVPADFPDSTDPGAGAAYLHRNLCHQRWKLRPVRPPR